MSEPAAILAVEDVARREFEASIVGIVDDDCDLFAVGTPVGVRNVIGNGARSAAGQADRSESSTTIEDENSIAAFDERQFVGWGNCGNGRRGDTEGARFRTANTCGRHLGLLAFPLTAENDGLTVV
jgi:hypothetical protein